MDLPPSQLLPACSQESFHHVSTVCVSTRISFACLLTYSNPRRPYQTAYRPNIKRAENGVIARATNTLSQSILEYSGSCEDNGTLCLNFILKFHSAVTDNPAFFVAHDLNMDFKYRTNDSSQLPMSVLHIGKGYRLSGYNNPDRPIRGATTAQDVAAPSICSQNSDQDTSEGVAKPDTDCGAYASPQRSGGGTSISGYPQTASNEGWLFDHIEVDSKITCSFSNTATSLERRQPLPNQCPFHVILAKVDQLISVEIYVYSVSLRSDGSSWAVGSKKKYVCTTIQWN